MEPDSRPGEEGSASEPDGAGPVSEPGHETPGGTPEDLRLTTGVLATLRAVGASYLRRLWPLLVVLAVPAVPVVVLSELGSVWPNLEPVVVNGALDPLNSPDTGLWVLLGVTVLVALALAPIALGGAILVGAGALLGRRVPVRAAWRQSVRRHLTVLGWLLALLLWIAVFLGLLFAGLFFLELPAGLVVTVLLPLTLYTLPVLVVALPVALLEGHRPLRALAVSWQMGRHRRLAHLLFVALAFGAGYLVNQGLEYLVSWSALQAVDPLLMMASAALVTVLLAPLWPLLVSAPVVLDATHRQGHPARELDLVAADRQLPGAGPAARRRAPVTTSLLVLAVFLPPAAAPLALWASGTTQVFTSPVESVNNDEVTLSITAAGDEALITADQSGPRVILCEPACLAGESAGNQHGGATLGTDAGLLQTHWSEYDHDDREDEASGKYDPHEDSGLYLRDCGGLALRACVQEIDPGVLLRPFGGDHRDTYSAIAPLGEGLVVTSYVRPDEHAAEEFDLEDRGGLHVQVCEDTACTDPRTVARPEGVSVGARSMDGMLLDVAVSPEDGFAVSAYDGKHGGLKLVHCPDTECAEAEVTEVAPASIVSEYEGHLVPRFGARVEYRPDGTPVAAYRAAQGGAAYVVDCHDPACAEFTDRAVTGPGWARPVPGLAVDSRGNPQLVTFDMSAEQVVLVSCLDGGCAETVTVPLRGFEEEPALTALTLDEADRPHLVWGQGTDLSWRFRDFRVTSEYVRCLEPRCGADGRDPDPTPNQRAAGGAGTQTP